MSPPMDHACATLVAAAIRAPSGDNTQPWRFVVDPARRLVLVELDESRDPSPMNSGQRMARIAIGAAVENMLVAAQRLGWTVRLEVAPPPALVAVRLVDAPRVVDVTSLDPIIASRVTNRRMYDGRDLLSDVVDRLRQATVDGDGIRAHWIHQRDRVRQLADLIGRSDALMLGEPSMRKAFLDNVRFDLPWDAAAEEGLSLGCLEVGAMDRMALRILPAISPWLVKLLGVARKFAAASRRLVESSSGLCIVTERDGSEPCEILAGRVVQRAWLKVNEIGMALQPMMSIAILESLLSRGSPELLKSLGRRQAEGLVAEFRGAVPEIGDAKLAFVARIGFAEPPTCVTGRRPMEVSARVLDQLGSGVVTYIATEADDERSRP